MIEDSFEETNEQFQNMMVVQLDFKDKILGFMTVEEKVDDFDLRKIMIEQK